MRSKRTILSLNSSQIKTFSFEYCSDIMHYPNKKISTTLKEIFRSVQGVATALLLFLKDNWSLFFLPWILFATDDDDVCVCVCVC